MSEEQHCRDDTPNRNDRMDDITILSHKPITESKYIRPMRVTYKQAGKEKLWDYMVVHNSVAILIYNKSIESFVLVKQFRPAIYMTDYTNAKSKEQSATVPPSNGITYELCAGIIDRDDEPCNIAASEVLEETGFQVAPDSLELICNFRAGIGTTGSIQWLYYVEVTDSMKVTAGGGCAEEGEMIDLFHLKLTEVESFIKDKDIVNKPSGALFALSWFLLNKRTSTPSL